ncbi:unnamed protein product [Peniophora sp. CBMAI 1063]|nr:unnamed protein product [Peniophora sp. CBMAI 1063]
MTTSAPLPLILAKYGGHSIAIPRPVVLPYAPDTVPFLNMVDSLNSAFPSISNKKYTIAAKVPGLKDTIEILPALWKDICANVTEVHVTLPLTEEEKRLKRLTEEATSRIHVEAPTGQKYAFDINFNCADARDLKYLVEQKIGVPIERQVLTHTTYNPRVGNKNRAAARSLVGREVAENDVLINCFVDPEDSLRLKISPKESSTLDVVIRARG